MKLFTKEIDKKLFAQYHLGSNLNKQKVICKIFNPYGKGTWYILNSDPSDPDYLWAIVDLFEVEVVSVSRSDLENIKVPPFNMNLERDLYFEPINAEELYKGLLGGKRFEDGGEVEHWIKSGPKHHGYHHSGQEGKDKFGYGGRVGKWRPSASQRREFAERMKDPEEREAYYARKEAREEKRRASSKFDYRTAGGMYVPTKEQHDASWRMLLNDPDLTPEQQDAANQVMSAWVNNEKIHHDMIHIVNEWRRAHPNM